MRVYINDVAVRDGFQIERDFVPTDVKVGLIDELSRTGLYKIEVASFVSPKLVPNMRDAAEVLSGIERRPGVHYVALVPNIRGAQDAARAPKRPDELNVVMSASETHNRANINRSHEQSLSEFPDLIRICREAGMGVTVSLSTTFGCPFEGEVPRSRVLDFVGKFHTLGFDGISLADTTGMADPLQVETLTRQALEVYPPPRDDYYTLHFHNTRGMGLANVLAGIRAGVRSFDGSIGGLGGCPFAPGATGNICTEDMVHMLARMGYDTGIDIDRLLAAARRMPEIVGHDVPGQVMKSGKSTDLHRPPAGLRG
jgi:hydroxymethylglutaryl-CoA lyase